MMPGSVAGSHVPRDAGTIRASIWERQGGVCLRCYTHLGAVDSDDWDAHHRLSRGNLPRDMPEWCTCNVVGLHHNPCHVYGDLAVHRFPEVARKHGLIVPGGTDPRSVPLRVTWPWDADSYLDCFGEVVSTLWTEREDSHVSEVEANL